MNKKQVAELTAENFPKFIENELAPNFNLGDVPKLAHTAISVFKAPITNTTVMGKALIVNIYKLIRSDKLKQRTQKLRSIKDKKANSDYKRKNFPLATFSGSFSKRSAAHLISASDLVCIDLDDLGDKLSVVKEKLITDYRSKDSLVLGFVSPNGNGYKAVYLVDHYGSDFSNKDYYEGISKYIAQLCQLEFSKIDESCTDIVRGCFLSHDPEAYINPQLLNYKI